MKDDKKQLTKQEKQENTSDSTEQLKEVNSESKHRLKKEIRKYRTIRKGGIEDYFLGIVNSFSKQC